jgi:hypothetical protein
MLDSLYRDLLRSMCVSDGAAGGSGGEATASIGGLVQLLVNLQYITASISRWDRQASVVRLNMEQLAEGLKAELLDSLHLTFLRLLTNKMKMLIPPVDHASARLPQSLLDDVFPYLDAVIPSNSHLPATLLYPLHVAALKALSSALMNAFAETPLFPAHVVLLKREAMVLDRWSVDHEIAGQDVAPLRLVQQLAELMGKGEQMLDYLKPEVRRVYFPLLQEPSAVLEWGGVQELSKWLSRLREEGTTFFGGAKQDKHAVALLQKLKQTISSTTPMKK